MRIYHWLVAIYALAAALTLVAIPLSAAGWITPDPLSAVPAILLGMPWSFVLLRLGDADSTLLNFVLVGVAMVINAAIIWLLGNIISRWRRR